MRRLIAGCVTPKRVAASRWVHLLITHASYARHCMSVVRKSSSSINTVFKLLPLPLFECPRTVGLTSTQIIASIRRFRRRMRFMIAPVVTPNITAISAYFFRSTNRISYASRSRLVRCAAANASGEISLRARKLATRWAFFAFIDASPTGTKLKRN